MLSQYFGAVGKIAAITLACTAVYLGLMVVFQRHYIYFPNRYNESMLEILAKKEAISYELQGHVQTAFYIPAKSGKSECLWVMLGGNAALALGWADLVAQYRDDHTAFLLVDYPGYGLNEGSPNMVNNLEAPLAAYKAMMAHIDGEVGWVGVLGHSLGSSVAVNFALKQPVNSVVLLSPFTAMQDMVKHYMPISSYILNYFLWDKYQVKSVLSQLYGKAQVKIIHGDMDEIVPVDMSRHMVEVFPWVQYQEIKGADHNFIYQFTGRIIAEMKMMCD